VMNVMYSCEYEVKLANQNNSSEHTHLSLLYVPLMMIG